MKKNGNPCFTPKCSLNQTSSSTQSNIKNSGTALEAEESLYDLTSTALLLTGDPGTVGIGLTMVALGPFLFAGTAPSTESYWNNHFSKQSISYGSWDQGGGNGTNCPHSTWTLANGPDYGYFCVPVLELVNDGNGNPSFTQYWKIMLNQQPSIKNISGSEQFALNYYLYSGRITVVPIAHCFLVPVRTSHIAVHFQQNDYVNTTYESCTYNGPSYTAATSLPLYLSVQG